MDQQGRVHIFQVSQVDSRNMKPTEQSTISLPGQAQATLAVASPSRTLIVDADGQAWSWKPGQAGNTKPSPIMQDQGVRIIQTAALNQGLLLLDADGQTRYLADSATSAKAVNLPENTKASRISASNDQAIITDKDGHLWLWKPGETPARAGNGNQHYPQAVRIGNEIAALDRQGGLYQWSIDAQGQPGKPAKIDSTTAPTLESASLDGQALTLSKTGDAWQADVPARDPGPAIITITGRQDDKPFTKSLNYTVDQPLLRDAQQDSTHTITFDTAGGSQAPQPQQVGYPYGRVKRPSPDPTRNGYQFYGWFIDNVAYDFSKPVTKDLRLTAHWSSNKWTISPDTGSQIGGERTTITPPTNTNGIKFNQISSSNTGSFSLAVGSDGNAYAWGDNTYGQLGDGTAKNYRYTPVMVQKPDRKTYPDLPTNFTYVQVSAGGRHSIALGSDGYAYAWGYNSSGQLGNNTKTDSHVPVRVRDPGSPADETMGLKAIQVSAGYWHSLALGSDGYAYSWGYNWYGQLGNNTKTDSYVPVPVRDPANPTDTSKGLKATHISAGYWHSLAVGSDGYVYAWGNNGNGRLGDGTTNGKLVPVSVMFNPQPVIAAAKFDTSPGTHLTTVSNSNSVTALTPSHQPGTVTVSVDYTMGGTGNTLTDTSLTYTYTPTGVLPQAGGEGILLALATGMTGMGGVLASRRHRKETQRFLHTSHE